MLHGVKTFVIIGRASHPELAARFVQSIRKVRKLIASHDGAFLAKVYVETGEVRLAMTLPDWFARQPRRRR